MAYRGTTPSAVDVAPDDVYPPPRPRPNAEPEPFGSENWQVLYGANMPPYRKSEPLPPAGPIFFFRVLQALPVRAEPDEKSPQTEERSEGEVVRVVDFKGLWARLACETEAQSDAAWQGWVLTEDDDGKAFLDEIEDPAEAEREFTKNLFRRVWKINDHVSARLRDRTNGRFLEYTAAGRLVPGKRDTLPEGTRCVNAFWGLEVRYSKLNDGAEYWPQGCLDLPSYNVHESWENPSEEARAGHWRVFAARPFGSHELVEVCPLVRIDDLQTCMASMPLRMNVVETPVDDPKAPQSKVEGRIHSYMPLGYGMLYQQSITLDDIKINWEPVSNYNCKAIAVNDHQYIFTTRRVEAGDELILKFERCHRTAQGEAIDFTGFTPYWCRDSPPENFAKALVTPAGPRKVRPIPGQVKFGKSKLHDRGAFADATYRRGEVIEMCPCIFMDTNGVDCLQDYVCRIPAVTVQVGARDVVKREQICVLPLGYGGVYNHLAKKKGENVDWYYDETTQCLVIIADPPGGKEEIAQNEELCFDYGEAFWSTPTRHHLSPNAGPS